MTTASDLLTSFSNALADAVESVAGSVVQVQGASRPASGLTYAADTVVTTVRALGREDGLHVRRADGAVLEAELIGWDPTTSLAALRVNSLEGTPIRLAEEPPRVGHLALAVARSWSNAVTATAGVVAVIGGPLRTGRRRAVEQVIRTTAPMHDGFAGGAFVSTSGALLGVATSTAIRGTRVVIPAPIAWKTAATIVEHGHIRRGYLGIAGQPAHLPEKQREGGADSALLIVGVTPGGPADRAGLLVGDVLLQLDSHPIESPEDLLDLLVGERVGRTIPARIRRGESALDVPITVGERPKS